MKLSIDRMDLQIKTAGALRAIQFYKIEATLSTLYRHLTVGDGTSASSWMHKVSTPLYPNPQKEFLLKGQQENINTTNTMSRDSLSHWSAVKDR